jgi:hypothetical protein
LAHEELSTELLLKRLFKTASVSSFIDGYLKQLSHVPFDKYISQLCAERGTVPDRIIKKSGINRVYGHQLFNGSRKPSRDKVIQLAISFDTFHTREDASAYVQSFFGDRNKTDEDE